MKPDPNIKCPYTAFQRTCRDIVAECDCPKFVHIVGTNVNTGEALNKYGCIDSFLHMLMIENSQQQLRTAASIDKLREEVSSAGTRPLQIVELDYPLRLR